MRSLVQALSESMYDLAHTGAQRVATLCREPSGLACWALELLEEQACMVSTAPFSFNACIPCSLFSASKAFCHSDKNALSVPIVPLHCA